MSLTVTIGPQGNPIACTVQFNQVSITYKATMRSTANFKIIDNGSTPAGTGGLTISQYFSEFMQISISVSELQATPIWTGYVDSLRVDPLPGSPYRIISVSGMDQVWLAQKRWFTAYDFTSPTYAGDIVSFLYQNYMQAEGVKAALALRYDFGDTVSNPGGTNFTQGTLVNTHAIPSGLTLLSSGATFRKEEKTTADFAAGALTNCQSSSNSLHLTPTDAIQLTGTSARSPFGTQNPYGWLTFVDNLSYAVQAGDIFMFDIFISTSSPAINGSVDIGFSDGSTWHDVGANIIDQYGNQTNMTLSGIYPNKISATYQGYADDQWYHREFILTPQANGKTVKWGMIGFDIGSNLPDGTYTCWAKNVKIMDSTKTVTRLTLYGGGGISQGQWQVVGFIPLIMNAPFTSYPTQGVRVGPSNSLVSVGVVQAGQLNYTETSYTPPQTLRSYPTPYNIETSWDGGVTWQSATKNGNPISGLLSGWRAATLSTTLQIRQTLNLAADTPLQTPSFTDDVLLVASGTQSTATSFLYQEYNNATFTNGTIAGTTYQTIRGGLASVLTTASALTINGAYDNWDAADRSNQTTISTHSGAQYIQYTGLGLQCTTGGDVKSQLNWAGNWQNLVCEFDVLYVNFGAGNWSIGTCYRTTFWADGNTFAYFAGIDSAGVTLERASNSSTPSWTQINHVNVTWTNGLWYHVKIVANGSNHQVFVNNTQYINVTDGTFSATGGMGLRFYNNTGGTNQTNIKNWGVQAYSGYSGRRTSPNISLASIAGTAGSSVVQWNALTPSGTSVTIEITLDGGAHWYTCVNGGPIPVGALVPNVTNLSAVTMNIRETLQSSTASITPYLEGVTVAIQASYASSGTRVSPSLSLAGPPAITDCGATSVSWGATTPTGTSVTIDTSINGGSTWQNVGNSTNGVTTGSGNPISGLTQAGAIYYDEYVTNTSTNYTNTHTGAGSNLASFTILASGDTKITLVGGVRGLLTWMVPQLSGPPVIPAGPTGADIVAFGCVSQSARSGILLRYVNSSNYYYFVVADSGSTQNPQTIQMFKCIAGTATALDAAPVAISFVQGTFHIVKFEVHINTFTLTWDGTVVSTHTDTGLSGQSGQSGFYNEYANQNAGQPGTAIWHFIRGQPVGSDVSGSSVITRATLQTTDPSVMPILNNLLVTVRSSDINSGLLVPSTSYSYNYTIADAMTDLATRSIGYWLIDPTKRLYFQQYTYPPAPFAIMTADILGGAGVSHALPQIYNNSPSYRNTEYIKGGNDLISRADTFTGNGVQTVFSLAVPIGPGTIPVITKNNLSQTVDVMGATGSDWYYVSGSTQIIQDAGGTPLTSSDTLIVTYQGNTPAFGGASSVAGPTFYQKSADLVAQMAALDGSTGIVEHVTTGVQVSLLTTSGCQIFAQSLISMNGILSSSWTFTTKRWGLRVGQQLTLFIPEFQPSDIRLTINEIQVSIEEEQNPTTKQPWAVAYSKITVTSGPDLGTWGRSLAKLTKATGSFV